MLRQQEPYLAFLIDRYWNLMLTNDAAIRLLITFIDLTELQTHLDRDGKINLMRVLFHLQGLRPFMVNWEKLAGRLLQPVQREAITAEIFWDTSA